MQFLYLAQPVTVRGSLGGAGQRADAARFAVIVAVDAPGRKALTADREIVDFDTIWVCDHNLLFDAQPATGVLEPPRPETPSTISGLGHESWHGTHWVIVREDTEGTCAWEVTGKGRKATGGNYDVYLTEAVAQVREALDRLGLAGTPEAALL